MLRNKTFQEIFSKAFHKTIDIILGFAYYYWYIKRGSLQHRSRGRIYEKHIALAAILALAGCNGKVDRTTASQSEDFRSIYSFRICRFRLLA